MPTAAGSQAASLRTRALERFALWAKYTLPAR
ncbi:hypothetical protein SAMN05216260_102470 [Streptomyces griseoaurantiacus]|uniref:Uncharacterized protein n=1 Tax=Streptomyces griseoaurantiacus TaxID=68213 RepID=A0A1G7E4S3_9ACTN|nr:hypothetical protein SAMN05216260_102470 [Streptomyces jietaisiensis]